jgi:hypothetical protein
MALNRRGFLQRLGVAMAGAAATLALDPEQLLWVPGQKTIIDLGATKHVVPATDAEIVQQATTVLTNAAPGYTDIYRANRQMERFLNRDVRLDIMGDHGLVGFKFKGDALISQHSAEDLKLLDKPFSTGRGIYPKW